MSGKFGTRKITASQMAELERVFHDESQDADGLDIDQFVEVFQTVLEPQNDANADHRHKKEEAHDVDANINSKRYLTHLFMKIDANSDGTVDWQEFLNFLLLENQGLESSNFDQQRDMLVRETMQCENFHSNHSDMISSILHFPNQSRYITGSLDGTIKLWDTSTFQIKKTILNSPNSSWVMDLVHLPLSKQIAAISMDGIINVYNSSSWKLNSQFMNKPYVLGENYGDTKKFKKEEQRWLITSTPVCADASVYNESKELLSVGTEDGKAFIYILDNNEQSSLSHTNNASTLPVSSSDLHFHVCSGDQSSAQNQVSIKSKYSKRNKASKYSFDSDSVSKKNEQIIEPVLGCSHFHPHRVGVEPLVMDVHNDWITHIEYDNDLQSLVSASLDSQIRFSDIERRKKTRIYMGHSKAVQHFAYNSEYKFMASCGVERKIHIFDPHRCSRLQLLVGHTTSISHVLMNEARHQLISLSYDKVIKIWDARTFRCLQTLHDKVPYQPDNRISALLFDNDNKRLVTCSGKLQSWPIRFQTQKAHIKSHDAAVSNAYFNRYFEQSVSSDFNGNIHVWDIENSTRVFRYSQSGEQDNCASNNGNADHCDTSSILSGFNEKITALAFDTSQRRVITGSDRGTLKIWNFSSGQCLCTFKDHRSKYAHWKVDPTDVEEKPSKHARLQYGTEISGIVYVMEVTSWTDKDVQFWFDSFRDRELRLVSQRLMEHAITGGELLELNHDILQAKYKIENASHRRKILNAIAGLYQSNAASKFIVSVGWDNMIRVWIDSTSKAVQHPISVMPSAVNANQSNQIEISCIAYYPPVSVVTGGADGSIAIWNVFSGLFQRKESYSELAMMDADDDISCTQVSWLKELKLIVTAHSNGTLLFWNPSGSSNDLSSAKHAPHKATFGWRHTAHKRFGGITAMVAAKKSTVIVTCDNASMLQIFDLSALSELIDSSLMDLKHIVKRENIWCTQQNTITCVDYLDSKDLILTCGHDGEVILWNRQAMKIGMFGQMIYFNNSGKDPMPKLWNLNDVHTFVDKQSRSEMDTIPDEPESAKSKTKTKRNKRKKKKKRVADGTEQQQDKGGVEQEKEEEEEEEEEDETMQNGDEPEVDGVQISIDTLNLIEHNNAAHDGSVDDSDVVLSNPELLAMLQKPASLYFRPKKRNILRGALMQQLKTCDLDELPRESPFK
eukprot:CAMPEP_0197028102 /NCGR_PEP_ID=MMETSP1384-20130603/7880_1 /TAXON_ID=29189 /ORGANISM="Ammonia sp." /LENGTH=1184 /DNA_ID=CAMNT_0042457053 /DNA_START=22 /DNA_END=3576 /DNA_ORIENTATION=-